MNTTKSFPLLRPISGADVRRTSSVHISIEDVRDNKAYQGSTEEICGAPDISKKHFDDVVGMNAGSSNGEFSGENFGNGERFEETGGAAEEKRESLEESGADLAKYPEIFVENSEESLTKSDKVFNSNDNTTTF